MNNKLAGAQTRLRRRRIYLESAVDRLNNPPTQGTYWKSPEFIPNQKRIIAALESEIKNIELEIELLTPNKMKNPNEMSDLTAEEFFRSKIKEHYPGVSHLGFSLIDINAEKAMRWAHEFRKLTQPEQVSGEVERITEAILEIAVVKDDKAGIISMTTENLRTAIQTALNGKIDKR